MQGEGKERKGKFEKGPRAPEPKYNDSAEAKAQMENIRKIEADMKTVQQKLGQLHSKGKEVDRKVKLTLKDKNKAEERVEGLLRRIQKLKGELAELQAGLKGHLDLVEQRRQAEGKAKQGLLRQRKKGQSDEEFVNSCLAAIDQRVKELNQELEQHAGSVAEERRILKEQQRVRATKTQIPTYLKRSKQFQEARASAKRAERDIESKQSFIATLEAELDDLKAEIAELDGKKEAETAPVKEALTTEEEQLTARLNELYAALRAAKDGLNENREKWYEARREKARKKQEAAAQRREEEQARRDAERKAAAQSARAERKAAIPYASEIRDCNMLLAYLDGLVSDNQAGDNNGAAAAAKPAGTGKKPIPTEEDDWGSFATQKKKGRKNKNKQSKPKFSITLQDMEQFVKLGFSAPMTLEDVPVLREKVAAKADELTKKSAAEHASTLAEIAKEEAEEAAAEAAAAEKRKKKEDAAAAETTAEAVTKD